MKGCLDAVRILFQKILNDIELHKMMCTRKNDVSNTKTTS